MNNKNTPPKTITFKQIEKKLLMDPAFVREWKKIEPEYEIARQIIHARLKKNMTQAELAKKVGTGQAVISRLEGANAAPSLSLLKRIASALQTPLSITIN